MNRKSIILLIFLCIIITIFFYFNHYQNLPIFLAVDDINIMKINGSKSIEYSKDKNYEEISQFVEDFNRSKRCRDDYSTTPNVVVTLIMNNQEKIQIFGGTQGFQTIVTKNMSFNVKGKNLWEFFKSHIGAQSNN